MYYLKFEHVTFNYYIYIKYGISETLKCTFVIAFKLFNHIFTEYIFGISHSSFIF